MSKPSWMQDEENRADDVTKTGGTANNKAPKLVRVSRAPERKQKAFYVQAKYAEAFELFVFENRKKGIKAPEMAEEMISDYLKKYGRKI